MVYKEKLMTEDGVALLFYRIELPETMSEQEAATAERITIPVATYLEEVLTEALRSEYLASEHPRRRFLFRRAEYRLTVRREADGTLTAHLTLKRGKRSLFESEERFTVSNDGSLFPLSAPGLKILRKKRKKQGNPLVIRG